MFPKQVVRLIVAFGILWAAAGAGFASAGRASHLTKGASAVSSSLGPEIVISSLDTEKHLPAVVYNTEHDEYLVVWQNNWAGANRDIYGRRVSGQGQVLSSFLIAPGPGGDSYDRAQPSVAYDPKNDRYLVVFIHDVFGNGSDWDIGGRFIPWEGPDSGLSEFPICNWNSSQWNPRVVYATDQEEFLVAWTNTPSGVPAYVSAARLNHNTGAVIDSFTVSSGAEPRINPDVAYNQARNQYLVVWDHVGANHDIRGVLLGATGTPLGAGEFSVAGWPDDEEWPAVAACGNFDRYVVGWQSLVGPPTNYDVYGRHVSGGGVLGTPFLVDGTTAPEKALDIACLYQGQQYLFAWQTMYSGGYYGIWGRLVYPDHMEDAFGLVQPGAATQRTSPAIAGGRVSYLSVWVHDRDATPYQDIRGRLVHLSQVYLPLLRR